MTLERLPTPSGIRRGMKGEQQYSERVASDPILSIRDLHKVYGDGGEGVRGLSLDVRTGEFLVLIGSSGSGKTTVLKTINRLIEPTSGSIRIDGLDVAEQDPVELRRQIGYVFQEIGLFPHMTVGRNIGVVPRLLGWDPPRIAARTSELLEMVGMPASRFCDRLPAQLSGGQQQRVGVARALAARPRIVLMDEPFGALDPLTRNSLQEEYAALHRRLGLTTVMVTHDLAEALFMADRIGILQAGRLVIVGTPAELFRSRAAGYASEILGKPLGQWKKLLALFSSEERP
ncbi:MAG: ATP-binding cassette domain-containing protein [Acidobacteriota bacterium]